MLEKCLAEHRGEGEITAKDIKKDSSGTHLECQLAQRFFGSRKKGGFDVASRDVTRFCIIPM